MKNILIVDDEPDIREILRYNLGKAGFNVIEASSGNDALNKLSKDLNCFLFDQIHVYDSRIYELPLTQAGVLHTSLYKIHT